MKDDIEYGDWVCIKTKKNIQIKVTIINGNGIIDFRAQRSEKPFHAHVDDLEKITDEDLISELEFNFQKRLSNLYT